MFESHEQLYTEVMAGKPDLIEEAGAFWPLLGKDFALLATKLGEEVEKSKDFWTGSAAENFRGTLTHLADECRRFDQQTQETHRVIASYAAHLREAQRVMPVPTGGAAAALGSDGGVGAWQAGQAHAAEAEARRVHDWISHHATAHAKQFQSPQLEKDQNPAAASADQGYYAGSSDSGGSSGSRGSYGTPGITWASGGTSTAPAGSGGETGIDLAGGPKAVVPPLGTGPIGGGPTGPGTAPGVGGPGGPGGYVPGLPPAGGVGGGGSRPVGARPGGVAAGGGLGGGRAAGGGVGAGGPGAAGGQRSTGGLPGAGNTAGAAGTGRTGPTGAAAGAGMGGAPMGGAGGGAGDNGGTRSPRPAYLREDPETWDVQKKGNPMVIE